MDYHIDNEALITTLLWFDEPSLFGMSRWIVMLLALIVLTFCFAMSLRAS